MAAACLASSPRELVQEGNAHYAARRYAEALEAYRQAAELCEQAGVALSAELLHNQAAVQFKLGNLDDARELWVRALALKDAEFEARARYNLGNCSYAEALAALQALQSQQSADPQQVLDALARATDQYRDAIRLDPGLENARANLELAHQLKKAVEERTTTQPQSQPSDDQDSQQQQGQQNQTTQPSDDQQAGESSSDGQDQESESPTAQPDAPEPEPHEPSTQPADDAQEPQPAEAPKSAEDQAGQPPADQPPATIRMTRAEAERLLQRIRDLEKARREALRRRAAARHKPVDRDW